MCQHIFQPMWFPSLMVRSSWRQSCFTKVSVLLSMWVCLWAEWGLLPKPRPWNRYTDSSHSFLFFFVIIVFVIIIIIIVYIIIIIITIIIIFVYYYMYHCYYVYFNSIIKDFLEVMSLLRIFGILLKGYKWVITYNGWLSLLSVGLVHKVQTIYSVEKLSKPKELCQPTPSSSPPSWI